MSESKKKEGAAVPRSAAVRRFGWMLLRSYVLLCILVYFFQGKLLYHPTTESRDEASRRFQALGLEPWPDLGDFRGLVAADETSDPERLIVWLHGNAGTAAGQKSMIATFRPLGARVHLHEFPGYSCREGEISEASLVADLAATLDLLAAEFPDRPLILMGESLGSAVACGALRRARAEVAALVLFLPFDRLADAAQAAFWFLPARLLLREDYDNVDRLDGLSIPLAVITAEFDRTIPPELGRRLFESYGGPKRHWEIAGAGHDDWRHRMSWSTWKELFDWLDASLAAPPGVGEDDR